MLHQKFLQWAARWIIILFCLWHGSAVAFYSLPSDAKNPMIVLLRSTGIRIVRPYMLITSQWQQWNLFAPDPLRRVTRYVIQILMADQWKTIAVLDSKTIPWWRDGDELKILRRLEEGDEYWYPVRARYLEQFCLEQHLIPGTPLRMVYDSTVIPKEDFPMPLSWWRRWKPQWKRTIGAKAVCPRQESHIPFSHTVRAGHV